jgi:heme A synthase
MSKSTALLIGLIIITLFGIFAFLFPERNSQLAVILTAIVTLVSAYIGLQVVNNGVKGKYFNQDLYSSENGDGK